MRHHEPSRQTDGSTDRGIRLLLDVVHYGQLPALHRIAPSVVRLDEDRTVPLLRRIPLLPEVPPAPMRSAGAPLHHVTTRTAVSISKPSLRFARRRRWRGACRGVNSTAFAVLGFRRFSVRGLDKVRGEWDLVCLALNIKRLQPLLAV